jgi:hypothetical protein
MSSLEEALLEADNNFTLAKQHQDDDLLDFIKSLDLVSEPENKV